MASSPATGRLHSRKAVLAYAAIGFAIGVAGIAIGYLLDPELRPVFLAGPEQWAELLQHRAHNYRLSAPFVLGLAFGFFGYRNSRMKGLLARQERMQTEIEFHASHDPLTGLVNRAGLATALPGILADVRPDTIHVFAMLDLSRLKSINDAFGHSVGDAAIRIVAKRLVRAATGAEVVARVGGDEFVVLFALNGGWDRQQVERAAQRLIEAVHQRIDVGSLSVSLGVSIGIYPIESHERDFGEILRKADVALYTARRQPESSYAFFDKALEAATLERNRMQHALQQALETGKFELHFQPIMSVDAGELLSFEALARWEDIGRGVVPPDMFIPILEQTGLIVPFGEWVIGEACRIARDWPADIGVSVNVSAVQFRTANLPAVIARHLATSGLPPHRLEIELTESVLIHDTAYVRQSIEAIKQLGVKISLDDFGTGYSSLNHLRDFPFDRIKIDRSFMIACSCDESAAKILRSVIKLGRILDISTVVEGVESREDLALIAAEGASAAQGYYFSPPVPAHMLQPFFDRVTGEDTGRIHRWNVA